MIDEDAIRRRFEALQDRLDERGRRLFAAAEVRAAGYGVHSALETEQDAWRKMNGLYGSMNSGAG